MLKAREGEHAKRWRQDGGRRFQPLPPSEPRALRLAIVGEIMCARGFQQDRLYIEFGLRFDQRLWQLTGPAWLLDQQAALGDSFQGKHISNVRPASPAACAHFSRTELAWLARPQVNMSLVQTRAEALHVAPSLYSLDICGGVIW